MLQSALKDLLGRARVNQQLGRMQISKQSCKMRLCLSETGNFGGLISKVSLMRAQIL